jgi:hypothetical protein
MHSGGVIRKPERNLRERWEASGEQGRRIYELGHLAGQQENLLPK